MSVINRHLSGSGICNVEPIYTPQQIAEINRVADPIFASRKEQARSYVYADEIGRSGMLPLILSKNMRNCLLSVMPDPVLYHMHIYEIAENQNQPHIFADNLAGWHRDPDSENGGREATHVSIFVYLTDVGIENGPFEFIPQSSFLWLRKNTKYVSMLGKSGSSFVWNRNFYHRAAPNRSGVRRRLLKISIQNSRFISKHLSNEHFKSLIAGTEEGDVMLDMLLGRYQAKGIEPPMLSAEEPVLFSEVEPNSKINLSNKYLLECQARMIVRSIRHRINSYGFKNAEYD